MCQLEDLEQLTPERWVEEPPADDPAGEPEPRQVPATYRCQLCGRQGPLNLLLAPTCEESAIARIEAGRVREALREAEEQERLTAERKRDLLIRLGVGSAAVLPTLLFFWWLFFGPQEQEFAGKTTSQWLEYTLPGHAFESPAQAKRRAREADKVIKPDPYAVPALLDAQTHKLKRPLANDILHKFTHDDVVESQDYLIHGLKHADLGARIWSARLLARGGPEVEDAIWPLKDVLQNRGANLSTLQLEASHALAAITTVESLDNWLKELQDDDPDVRAAAADVILHWPEQALQPLWDLHAAAVAEAAQAAERTLVRLGEPAVQFLVQRLYDAEDRQRAAALLQEFAGEQLQPLTAALEHEDPAVRQQAIEVFAAVEDAPPEFRTALPRLARDQSEQVRKAAQTALKR